MHAYFILNYLSCFNSIREYNYYVHTHTHTHTHTHDNILICMEVKTYVYMETPSPFIGTDLTFG